SAFDEAAVKAREHARYRRRGKVNRNVAAENDVDVRDAFGWRGVGIGLQIMSAGGDEREDTVVDPPALAVQSPPAFPDYPRRAAAEGPRTIDSLAGDFQRIQVDVGGENFNLPREDVGKMLEQQDRDRVGLLARRAAGAPDRQRPRSERFLFFDQLR